ncbi:MAG: metal ABC transporter ATP-binding protein [Wenzhouxiangella sp.]
MIDSQARGSAAAVQIEGLSVAYGSSLVLDRIDLTLPAACLISVVGPNGAGKSTLLRALVGSLKPVAGRVLVHGRDAESQRRRGRIAYMPQHEQIDWDFPLSVHDVVLSGRFGRIRAEDGWRRFLPPSLVAGRHRQAVRDALDSVDMLSHRHQPIDTLSGGQRKRVLLARALAQDASLLLLDEPLVGVDRRSEALIMEVLGRARDQGRTVVMVTHDIAGARRDADFAVLINRQVVDSGDPRAMLTEELLSRTATAAWLSNRGQRSQSEALELT